MLCAGQGFGYRLTEVNSFYGGGQPGVSDTFGSALWCLDYLLDCAAHGCQGVNLETDVNQHGWVSHYSPVFRDVATNTLHARPEYYAMLAFSLAGNGMFFKTTLEPAAPVNLTAYAAQPAYGTTQGVILLTLVNKDLAADARVVFALPDGFTRAACDRLTAPSAESKEGTILAGNAVTSDGHWHASAEPEPLPAKDGQITLTIPHASAALLRLQP